MTTIRPITLATLAVLALAAVAAFAPAAAAKDGDAVRVRGTCTQASTAKLKLSREDSRIEVEFEVDQNRNGVRWNVTLKRNGVRVASATAVTRGPSGSFEVRKLIARSRATDRITAVATRTGERCSAGAAL